MIYFITLLLYICKIQTNAVKLASNSEQDYHYLGYKDKLTVKGIRCIFPFSYQGVKYNDCAPGVSIGQPSPWCAISTKDDYANTVKNWDVCVSDESRLTVKGTRCIFPFVYRGVTFTSCAPGVSQPSPWCATLLQDNLEPKEWDVCVPDTRMDDKVCKSLTKDNCKSKSIIELCSHMCSEEIDEEFCLLLDKDQCRKESINKRCPQFCSKAVCIPKCINGKCTDDNMCACNTGWIGGTCEIAECDPKCINGICTDAHRCRCDERWIGQACDIAECNPRCINGFCNDNSRCTCYDGYIGAACDGLTCSESGGFFKLPGSVQCFKVYLDQRRSWTDSDGQCKSEGLALAEPNNPIQLRKYLNGKNGGKYYWLGGVGTGSSVEFQRGGGNLYPGDALWMSGHPAGHPEALGMTRAQCLIMTAHDYHLRPYPSKPYWTSRCSSTTIAYALCELVVE